MSEINKNSKTSARDSGSLLEARDNALVVLVAEETQLVVHRSVLETKSPVFAAALAHDMVEASSGHIVIADVEPKVLHQLLLLMYKGSATQLCNMAPQLLVLADRYCMPDLKAQCEDQLVLDLSVENAVTSALLAIRHSCPHLKETATHFLITKLTEVMATEGWAEAVRCYPEEFLEVSRLVTRIPLETRSSSEEEMNPGLYKRFRNPRWPVEGLLPGMGHLEAEEGSGWSAPICLRDDIAYSLTKVKVLLEAGADVEARDTEGRTALHYAAAKGDTECLPRSASVSGSANMSQINENSRTKSLGALLEARDNALLTLVVGETELVVHRSVLVERSPVFAAMLANETTEASSSRIVISDIDPEMLQQLLLSMYKNSAPQICDTAPQLLVAADKYCMPDVKEQCELQLVLDLSVENALTGALLALRHSCPRLKEAAKCFLQANLTKVMLTEAWAEAVHNNPEEFMEVCHLIATKTTKISVSGSENLSEIDKTSETTAYDTDPLLETKDAASITLMAGDLQMAVPKSVLVDNSPVFAAMLTHDTAEARSGHIVITDVEPKVLQQLVLFMYKGSTPRICSMAPQLLVAADKYGLLDLKEACELQMAKDLSVENVMRSALLALRHFCPYLKKTARSFFLANLTEVMGTEGWAQAVRNSPEEVLQVSHLVATAPLRTRSESQKMMDQMLLKAAENGRYSDLKGLLASGANMGTRDVRGRTALHIAAGREFGSTTLKLLLEAGTDVETRDTNGRTALHYAAGSGFKEGTECLVRAGAHLYARDRWLNTPLHTALQRHKHETVVLLVTAATDVNISNVYGDTPLHLAAEWGDRELVTMLLRKGADKGSKNYCGDTPLVVAKKCKMRHLLDLLSRSQYLYGNAMMVGVARPDQSII